MRRDIDCALVIDSLGGAVPKYEIVDELHKFFVLDKNIKSELVVNELDGYSTVFCPLIECDSVQEVGRCGNFYTDPKVLEGVELLLKTAFLHENVSVLQAKDVIEAEEKATSFFIAEGGAKAEEVDTYGKLVFYSRDDMKIYSSLDKDAPEHIIGMFGPTHRFKLKDLPDNRIVFARDMEFLGVLPISDFLVSYGAFVYHMKWKEQLCANIVAVDLV